MINLPSDAFERIRQTEAEAENIIGAAKRKAAEVLEAAEREADRLAEDNAIAAKRNTASRVTAAERENQIALERSLLSVQAEKEAMTEFAAGRVEFAVAKVIEVLGSE